MKNRFDLLVFDWDGTLCDSIGWIVKCIQQAALACGVPVPSEEAARSVIGLRTDVAMMELFPGSGGQIVENLVAAYRENYFSKPVGEEDLFAGVTDMLCSLQEQGYKLAVATGKTSKALSRALEATATESFFDTVRSAEAAASKPDPEMLLQIMTELDIPRERTLMIGDSVHDLRMALNARVDSVGVACGANTQEQLSAFSPLVCLDRTTELLDLLG
ncbi:MAG TPA: HAD-IA family hydrolase [Methylococcaceae bacterium]|jgi:phosphoglycolate phosphatase|nr:HAD-IA family hydrolase [Methylococcaceae bacterium]